MKARVLIVDDEDTIRNLLRSRLEREGHDVSVASNADEAIAQFSKGHDVGVLITDLRMPAKMASRSWLGRKKSTRSCA